MLLCGSFSYFMYLWAVLDCFFHAGRSSIQQPWPVLLNDSRGLPSSTRTSASPRNAGKSARDTVLLSVWVRVDCLPVFCWHTHVRFCSCTRPSLTSPSSQENSALKSNRSRKVRSSPKSCALGAVSVSRSVPLCARRCKHELSLQKCPFEAIQIINLPKNLERDTTHRYGPNSFKLHRLPMPRPGNPRTLMRLTSQMTNGARQAKCWVLSERTVSVNRLHSRFSPRS